MIILCCNVPHVRVCIVPTGWGLTTGFWRIFATSTKSVEGALILYQIQTLVDKGRTDGWGLLNTRKAGGRVGLTAWTWTSQQRRARSLALATCCIRTSFSFQQFMRLLASYIQGEIAQVAGSFHSSGYYNSYCQLHSN